MTLLTRVNVTTKIGQMSLIGVSKERPTRWGNYFWLATGERVLNFWAENLTSADEAFNLNGEVSALMWTDPDVPTSRSFVFIDDERIPPEWYHNTLCFTGSGHPPVEVLQEWFTLKGDPTNEMEQFSDPKEYHAKRGWLWTNGSRITGPSVRAELEAHGYGPFGGNKNVL